MFQFTKCLQSRLVWPTLLLLTLGLGFSAAYGQSNVDVEVDRAINQAVNHCFELDFEQSLATAQQLLDRPGLKPSDQAAAYSVMGMVHYAIGKDHYQKAWSYLDKIMDVGPCVHKLPPKFWVRPLREHWYSLCNASGQLSCDRDSTIQTIAIMEFDNYSTGKYLEELGYITKGLSDFFEADFAQLNNLTVVERDKIDFILKEVMMTQEGLVDQATAVKAGKLLGAQIMVFGSVMQLDHKTKRMMVKAVKVETSEILVTAEQSGKDFFEMESELVKELAQKLDMEMNDETKNILDANGTKNGDAAGLYSRGVYHIDKYEYTEAYEFFKKAYEADNSFTEAKTKMDLYRPLAESS